MAELHLSDYWNETKTRRASISRDEYHYIVRMEARHYGMMKHYHTELLDKNLRYAEDCAENFVHAIGSFQHLDWPDH